MMHESCCTYREQHDGVLEAVKVAPSLQTDALVSLKCELAGAAEAAVIQIGYRGKLRVQLVAGLGANRRRTSRHLAWGKRLCIYIFQHVAE